MVLQSYGEKVAHVGLKGKNNSETRVLTLFSEQMFLCDTCQFVTYFEQVLGTS